MLLDGRLLALAIIVAGVVENIGLAAIIVGTGVTADTGVEVIKIVGVGAGVVKIVNVGVQVVKTTGLGAVVVTTARVGEVVFKTVGVGAGAVKEDGGGVGLVVMLVVTLPLHGAPTRGLDLMSALAEVVKTALYTPAKNVRFVCGIIREFLKYTGFIINGPFTLGRLLYQSMLGR